MIELADAELLKGLPAQTLARLVGELEEVRLQPGEAVFRRGDAGDCLYIVRAGVAEARAGPGDDGQYPLALYEAGESFGESALLTDEPRSSTVLALTELKLWALPKERFLTLIEQMPALALAVGRAVSRRLQATHQAVSSMHRAFDVVADQAYRELDAELQGFLRRTAPLDPVVPEIAARALGRSDAGQILAYLDARLPFVSRDPVSGYHYHPLFRELLGDLLRRELGDTRWRDWLTHLADCARVLGHTDHAVRLLLQAESPEAAERLAAAELRALVRRGELDRAQALVASLPPLPPGSTSELADARADLLVAQGQYEEAARLIESTLSTREGAVVHDELRQRRYRRLAELNLELGRTAEAYRWANLMELGAAADVEGSVGLGELRLPERAAGASRAAASGLLALASVGGLRKVSGAVGALGGRGLSRPIGLVLSVVLILWFALAPPPPGLSREAFLALGVLVGALPLLVFTVLPDHFVTLLMAAGWAGFGLVPASVALSGFATPGWFLVLAVLAVGVALARSGLLYRLVLTLLVRLPPNHVLLSLAVALAGIAISPAMPNATARTALAAPLALELADALGYPRRGRGSAAIALVMLLGFGQMCALFVTASSSGLLVYGLLPADSRARFGFLSWFVAALPLHLVIFVLTFLAIQFITRPERPKSELRGRVEEQRRVLGPISRHERVAAVVFVFLLVAFVFGPTLGIEAAWAAIVAMVLLGVTGVLDQQGFRNGVNWSFLLFFGVMISMAEVFEALRIDSWFAVAAAGPLTPLANSPALFLLALALAGFAINLVVRWQAACVLMTLVLVPAVAPLGIEPWVVGMTALVTTNMWFLPYQSTIYQALYYGTEEQAFTHSQARPVALAYGVACLVGLVATVPVWQAMGLLP